ncbi:aromatic amino acid transaminase [Hirschia litorea]|uniref:Aromatic amino acid transaminase n=1 Tax=Hirschia litorea TaxID=1199156 RepID=A0ABW2IN08_9PROT
MSNALISNLSLLPPDALLGLMAAYKEDPRDTKVDLGVGIYKDDAGQTPVLKAVKAAEEMLLTTETSKAYEGPRGNQLFDNAVERQIFGDNSEARAQGRVVSLASPGGCGALSVAVGFVKRLSQQGVVWVSSPSWPNHAHVVRAMGMATDSYAYDEVSSGPHAGKVDFEGIKTTLAKAKAGDGIIIQGPCHNPTGIDLDNAQWEAIAHLCVEKSLFPIVDVAYHGFGNSLDEDMLGVRRFLSIVPEALVSYSCSKNFGLYRERTGCLVAQTQSTEHTKVTLSHLADIARASYSMPPSHGAAIVATILDTPALYAMWVEELDLMRGRITSLREAMALALRKHGKDVAADRIVRQKGMFSLMQFEEGAAQKLVAEHAIYLPNSGRINVAGLKLDTIEYVAKCMAPYLK